MKLMKYVPMLVGVALTVFAYQRFGWQGVLVVTGGIVMWALLHITRTMKVMQNAANRPIGYVGSAVMLNAKLKPGMTLLHVIAMTKALGEQISAKDVQPEIFRWTDGTQSRVDCEFADGKLVQWALFRPVQADDANGATGAPAP
ncbi:glycerate kinase [Rhodoferax koreense]|uniref:Glycerate kinase n=1 Tax=Rhodoferax koreensis TaxID=1842727 RepID=A0A1P8JQG3_9BURK|nr:glycerate kinase [Rhodoferax koreense]APW35996.1 glycerate kinase [Rhodoferax koreense]